jgi:DNA (cytosine-5)-methyltransferase 1
MRHGSLFSGGGGFDIAAEWMGWENVFHCEVNPFAKKILKYWWPAAISYDDITKTDFSIHRGTIDILTGGFPCQPFSNAGQQKGTADPRYLWPEMLRVIREIRPRWIVGENVYGLVNWSGGLVFDTIKFDLEDEGYEIIPVVLPAAGVNAPHNRARIWFIAKDTNKDGWRSEQREGQPGKRGQWDTGAGDHERLRADNGETGVTTDTAGELFTRDESRECGDQEWEDVQQDYREDDTKLTKPNGKDGATPNTPSQRREERQQVGGQQDSKEDSRGLEFRDQRSGNDGNVANTDDKGLQGREFDGTFNQEGKERRQQPPRSIAELYQAGHWEQFPTQSPICGKYDGISDWMVRHIKPEIYASITEKYSEQDLQKVWDCLQSKEVREQLGRLYKIYEPQILLKVVQLCSASNTDQKGSSAFSEETSQDLLRKLQKYGSFANTPQGRELEKQFRKQFGNSLPLLSHEIALVAMEVERRTISAWSVWRRESIKLYGNAVVPQLVMQIFKTIELYEHRADNQE